MQPFNQEHAKLLYFRFSVIYGDKFVKTTHDDQFKSIWCIEWCSGLQGIDLCVIKSALGHCKLNLEWPPSIAEFRRICESFSGVPSMEKALAQSLRGEFVHPVTLLAYEEIGSWAMKNSKEVDLEVKFKTAYNDALAVFRSDPTKVWEYLKNVQERKALPAVPSKIPTQEEIIGWRERFKRYQAMAAADKLKLQPKDHPTWEKAKVTLGHPQFDEAIFIERKKYLIALDETVAGSLPHEDWYDRVRYMRSSEIMGHLNDNPIPKHQKEEKTSVRSSYARKTVYKHWMSD